MEAKDSFQALWFEEHMRAKVQDKLVNGNHKKIKVHLTTIHSSQHSIKKKYRSETKKNSTSPFLLTFDELNPTCSFDTFITNAANQLTYQIIAEHGQDTSQPPSFNPVYLYGPSGSGKTHLLMSLAKNFKSKGLKVIYIRADTFANHVVTAIRASEMSIFRATYRNVDVLLVDDIHVFSRKGATQEEFFHTFNSLHLSGKLIVFSANCPPIDLQLIEPRLVSRFEWGIVLPLKPLNRNELKALLETKAKTLNFSLPLKIINYLIEIFKSPKSITRALEAIILRLHLDSHHSIQNLSISAVKTLLNDLIIEEEKLALTPPIVVKIISEHYGIRIEDILGKAQTKECVLPRQLAMHLCREKLKMPFTKIGDFFSRDHSTVIASVRHIQTALDQHNQTISFDWHTIVKKLDL